MTSPPGYTRNRARTVRVLDVVWAGLRRHGPITLRDLARRTGGSYSQIKRLLRAARAAGWVVIDGVETVPAGLGTALANLYRLSDTAPPVAPVLTRQGHDYAARPVPTATGAELRAWRAGRTPRQAATLVGIADLRTYRRYEAAEAIPASVARAIGLMD